MIIDSTIVLCFMFYVAVFLQIHHSQHFLWLLHHKSVVKHYRYEALAAGNGQFALAVS